MRGTTVSLFLVVLMVSLLGAGCAKKAAGPGDGSDASWEEQERQRLEKERQLREMLGPDKDKLDWVWLIDDAAPVPSTLQAAAAQAHTLRLAQAQIAAWLKPEAGHALQDHIYVVDPMGNWMMRFPADLQYKKAHRDLSRLLRAAKSWDRAGRGVLYE